MGCGNELWECVVGMGCPDGLWWGHEPWEWAVVSCGNGLGLWRVDCEGVVWVAGKDIGWLSVVGVKDVG